MNEPRPLEVRMVQHRSHATAIEKGWWPEGKDRNIPELLALIHSEVSEVLDAYRKAPDDELRERLGEELADVVIRVMDMAAYLDINMEYELMKKMQFNEDRPHRHGGRRC